MSITMLLFSGPVEAMKPAINATPVVQHTPQTQTRRQTDERGHALVLGQRKDCRSRHDTEMPIMQRTNPEEEDGHHDPSDGPELRRQRHDALAEDPYTPRHKHRLNATCRQLTCWSCRRPCTRRHRRPHAIPQLHGLVLCDGRLLRLYIFAQGNRLLSKVATAAPCGAVVNDPSRTMHARASVQRHHQEQTPPHLCG